MKRTSLGSGLTIFCVSVIFSGMMLMDASALEMRLANNAGEDHPNSLAADRMVQRIAERTNGAIEIKVFHNNQLGSPPETAQQVRLGVIDFVLASPSQLDKFDRTFGVVMIPYQFDDYAHAHRALDGPAFDWFQQHAEAFGMHLIANFEWGFRALSNSKRPVNSPADMKGMKLRVPPEIQIKASMEALGAVTVTIAFPELYMALANKTVDGQDNPLATNYSSKFFEVQNNMALTNHVYNQMMLAASLKSWKKLSPEQQEIIREEGIRAGNEARAEVQEKVKWYISEMEKAGVKFTYPDVSEFRPLMEPAYKTIREWTGDEAWETWAKFVKAAR